MAELRIAITFTDVSNVLSSAEVQEEAEGSTMLGVWRYRSLIYNGLLKRATYSEYTHMHSA
jgi:hypothetical protein